MGFRVDLDSNLHVISEHLCWQTQLVFVYSVKTGTL